MIVQYILRFKFTKKTLVVAASVGGLLLFCASAPAYEVLGEGTEFLIGNDLTDVGDDGDPESDDGYDAIFDANDEPGFGGGESAFNVFDNILGPGNDKWCCGIAGGITEEDPMWVSAQLPVKHFLTNFTVSSANDVPNRDPIHWSVQGSNNGTTYTDIYTYNEDVSPWGDVRFQVIEFKEVADFPKQTTSYEYFRMATFNTQSNPSGAYFQVGEIEYFGTPDGAVPPLFVGGEGTIGTRAFEGDQSNKKFGPEMPGVSGWKVKLVDSDTTINDHTTAEQVLDTDDGTVTIGSYTVVDLAGGSGSFPENLPYPNDVAGESMEDFAVRATAGVVIPVGKWSIGFGTDDGGQLTIPGVTFDAALTLNSDSSQDDQIRFEGNRGHGWTVGSFEVTGNPLETTITASMHERGGGDTFEIAVIDGEVVEAASPDNGWTLLGNGTEGWKVTHTGIPLVSADLTAQVTNSRPWQFDVNGDTNTADQFVLDNPDPKVFTSILNIDGVPIQIKGTGAFANGDAFKIIDANKIVGTPIISSVNPAQNWVFDVATGRICLGTCPGGVAGDYNGNGQIDAGDLDVHSQYIKAGNLAGDVNGDGNVNTDDRAAWVERIQKSYLGDSNFDGEFSSSDFVTVFVAGLYETGRTATYAQGDWSGDMLFDSSDFVAAFIAGGYEKGKRGVAAVPEPSSCVLLLTAILGVVRMRRRR